MPSFCQKTLLQIEKLTHKVMCVTPVTAHVPIMNFVINIGKSNLPVLWRKCPVQTHTHFGVPYYSPKTRNWMVFIAPDKI